MTKKSKPDHSTEPMPAFGHAIVIGSSTAGLTAARVLADYFAQVTIIERDELSTTPEYRRGLPQTRHAHSLPVRGQTILEQLFPGLLDELVANGAIPINSGSEMAFFIAGKWHEVKHNSATVSMTSSRPLLDTTIYRRLLALPNVRVIQEREVAGLAVDGWGQRVAGVRLRGRQGLRRRETIVAADLVLDASGRNSRAPEWLAELGYTPPGESIIDAFSGYASRFYRRPADFSGSWKTLYVRPSPPHQSRGGLLIPIEGERWHVTLIGMGGDYPPTDPDSFMEFARSLPTPQLYEAIKAAEPLTSPWGYRSTANRVRHYDQLPRYLEGFLVTGDAVYTLNPVYAQGMTAAVLGSEALAHTLAEQMPGDLAGLAQAFQTRLKQAVASAWQMATREDQRWPNTEVVQLYNPDAPRRPQVVTQILSLEALAA